MDISMDNNVFWAQQRIRLVLLERGAISRRDLQKRSANRKWTAREFDQALRELLEQGGVAFDKDAYVLIDKTPPLDPIVTRRHLRGSKNTNQSNLRAAVWDKTDGICWYCGRHTNPFRDFDTDHVTPITRGGEDDISNIVPACLPCKFSKQDRTVEEFQGIYPSNHRFYFQKEGKPS